ncbi:MAG: TraB/GumN family protein [Gammaproteobacteria bacterium]
MKMKKTLSILACLFMATFLSLGYAGVYKCKNPEGRTVFQDRPCSDALHSVLQTETSQQVSRHSDRHFLWKASSPMNTIHLLGSIHFGSTEMYPLPEVVTKAYEGADALIVEVNTNETDDDRMTLFLTQSGSYPEGETVENHLDPETWKKLTRAAKAQQLDLQKLQNQQPWLISLGLTTLAIQRSGFSPEFGIDQYFITGAEGKKPILELESAQEQMNLLSTFSLVEQDELLKETLEQLDQATVYFRSLLEAWQSGDTGRIKELTQNDIDTDPEAKKLYDALFVKRNHSMTEKIVKLSESGQNYFVVVGAGHLVGEEGIVELLRGRGYEVTQL